MSAFAHQATCVAIGGRGLLIEGAPGSGKSSLAIALIDRGAILVGDDGVMLEPAAGRLIASAHPRTEGKLEIRNVGIVELPFSPPVPVALLVRLDPAAPRFLEGPDEHEIAGCVLPRIVLWPDSPVLALRAEWALRLYGIR
jgi:serine kinase of HPr protein (carbohydrate metabolism regulator)